MSIRDDITAAMKQRKTAQDKFLVWLDEQDSEDVAAINNSLRQDSPNPSVRDIADLLIAKGAPLTANRLYSYRTSLRGQRVKG